MIDMHKQHDFLFRKKKKHVALLAINTLNFIIRILDRSLTTFLQGIDVAWHLVGVGVDDDRLTGW